VQPPEVILAVLLCARLLSILEIVSVWRLCSRDDDEFMTQLDKKWKRACRIAGFQSLQR